MLWLPVIVSLAIAALLSGVTVGLVAASRHWTAGRIYWTANVGWMVVFVLGGLVQERMRLPYPPRFLADSGYPFLANWASGLLMLLSLWLAGWLARRVAILRTVDQ